MIRRPAFKPRRILRSLAAVTVAVFGLAAPAEAQQKTERVRLGAFGATNELYETHGDWSLSCRVDNMQKICTLLQSLADRESRKPLLSMELAPVDEVRLQALMTFSFDVDIQKGVQLLVDGKESGAPLPFKGCDSNGCHVATILDNGALPGLKQGSDLRLRLVSRQTGKRVIYPASLAGFAAAHERAIQLLR